MEKGRERGLVGCCPPADRGGKERIVREKGERFMDQKEAQRIYLFP